MFVVSPTIFATCIHKPPLYCTSFVPIFQGLIIYLFNDSFAQFAYRQRLLLLRTHWANRLGYRYAHREVVPAVLTPTDGEVSESAFAPAAE